MCDRFRAEFRTGKFGFNHEAPLAFVTSQWRWHPAIFLTYRVVAAIYSAFCYIFIVTIATINKEQHNIMAYLTMWTYLVLTIYMWCTAIVSIVTWRHATRKYIKDKRATSGVTEHTFVAGGGVVSQAFEKDPDQKGDVLAISETRHQSWETNIDTQDQCTDTGYTNLSMKWYIKLVWFLADVEYVFCIVVSVIYFTALFPAIGKTNIHDLNMHAFNTVLILIDVALVARPIRLLHVIYPVTYGLCYIIFSIIYWHQDPDINVLYPSVLDWNHPYVTVGVVLGICVIFLPLVQLLHFGLFRLRLKVFRKIYDVDYELVQ